MKDKKLKRVPRLFKLPPGIDERLRKEAKDTARTDTAVVVLALTEYLSIKR